MPNLYDVKYPTESVSPKPGTRVSTPGAFSVNPVAELKTRLKLSMKQLIALGKNSVGFTQRVNQSAFLLQYQWTVEGLLRRASIREPPKPGIKITGWWTLGLSSVRFSSSEDEDKGEKHNRISSRDIDFMEIAFILWWWKGWNEILDAKDVKPHFDIVGMHTYYVKGCWRYHAHHLNLIPLLSVIVRWINYFSGLWCNLSESAEWMTHQWIIRLYRFYCLHQYRMIRKNNSPLTTVWQQPLQQECQWEYFSSHPNILEMLDSNQMKNILGGTPYHTKSVVSLAIYHILLTFS